MKFKNSISIFDFLPSVYFFVQKKVSVYFLQKMYNLFISKYFPFSFYKTNRFHMLLGLMYIHKLTRDDFRFSRNTHTQKKNLILKTLTSLIYGKKNK